MAALDFVITYLHFGIGNDPAVVATPAKLEILHFFDRVRRCQLHNLRWPREELPIPQPVLEGSIDRGLFKTGQRLPPHGPVRLFQFPIERFRCRLKIGYR